MYNHISIYQTKQRQRAGENIKLSHITNYQENNRIKKYDNNKKIKPLIYRYKLYQNGKDSSLNSVFMLISDTDNLVYNAMGTLPIYNKNWNLISNSYIVYTGFRTKASTDPKIIPQIPSIYTETLDMHIDTGNGLRNNFITAKLNYVDGGVGQETELSYLKFTILGADGIFKNRKSLEIFYNNINYTREIRIT